MTERSERLEHELRELRAAQGGQDSLVQALEKSNDDYAAQVCCQLWFMLVLMVGWCFPVEVSAEKTSYI